jgi:hypothetical protein
LAAACLLVPSSLGPGPAGLQVKHELGAQRGAELLARVANKEEAEAVAMEELQAMLDDFDALHANNLSEVGKGRGGLWPAAALAGSGGGAVHDVLPGWIGMSRLGGTCTCCSGYGMLAWPLPVQIRRLERDINTKRLDIASLVDAYQKVWYWGAAAVGRCRP